MKDIICKISAKSENGFSDPTYSLNIPSELLSIGFNVEKWVNFINEANEFVKFRWCPDCAFWLLCLCLPFFCNQHNKTVSRNMKRFCDKWNKRRINQMT